ncbi:MAG: M20/M25/M40 family metallo-hydrolase [Ilumatobacteraceae bacterium]
MERGELPGGGGRTDHPGGHVRRPRHRHHRHAHSGVGRHGRQCGARPHPGEGGRAHGAGGEKERLEGLFNGLGTTVEGARIEVLGGVNRPPMPATASAALLPLAQAAAAALGAEPLAGIAVGGGSDGNFTAARGVPTLDGLGAVGGGAHADHEHVLVDALVPRTRLLAAILERMVSTT